jgi:hypothetical protein
VVVPERTGVVMLNDEKATSSGTSEIVTLIVHAEVALRVNLPGRFAFRISWYQGMEGFTGWHGGNDTNLPWNNSTETEDSTAAGAAAASMLQLRTWQRLSLMSSTAWQTSCGYPTVATGTWAFAMTL